MRGRSRSISGSIGLLGLLASLGCVDGKPAGDDVIVAQQAIINGDTANAASVNQALVKTTILCSNGGAALGNGSASFLTNEWLLTAAHVVDGDAENVNCKNGRARADIVEVSFAGQTITGQAYLHPRWNPAGTGTDMALIHVGTPFTLNGSTTGYSRGISKLDMNDLFGRKTRCYGYGRSSRTSNATGVLRFADFVIGSSGDVGAFKVFKGGGPIATDSGNGHILAPGDSGGGCVDPQGTAGKEDVFGINRDDEIRPFCTSDAQCPDSGTCNKATGVCSTNDPSFSSVQAASSFRDFASAALTSLAPPVQADFDGDGFVDATMTVQSILGFFFIRIQTADGSDVSLPTLVPDLPVVVDTIQSFTSLNVGDFNNDKVDDVLALVGGVPFYFNSGNGPIDLANPFTGTIAISGDEGFAYSTVRDFNGDGFDDAELVRPDGTATLFFGGGAGLGAAVAPPSYGPDFDGDGLEDIAVGAQGDTIPPDVTPGTVHIIFGDGSARSYSGDYTNADRDGLGSGLAWGNFDGDGPDELLVWSRKGLTYIDQGSTRFLKAKDVSDPPYTTAFGASLAVGDFDNDGYDDAAVSAGGGGEQVQILFGAPGGLRAGGRHLKITGADLGLGQTSFGGFAAGDFNCDGRSDLAMGYAGPNGGKVVVILGSDSGPSVGNSQFWDADTVNVGPGANPGDTFGAVMVAGNFNGDQQAGVSCDDLAIAATHQNAGIAKAGAVYVLYGGQFGLSETGSQMLAPCCGVPTFPDGNFGFGYRMAISHLNTDGYDDLLVGWPNFESTVSDEGQVFAYAGAQNGLNTSAKRWARPGTAIKGSFGLGVGGTSTGLVAIGTPFEGGNSPLGGVHLIEPNGIAEGASLRFGTGDFPQAGVSVLGIAITGPHPGRVPARQRARAGLANFRGGLTQKIGFTSFEDPLRGWTSSASLTLDTSLKSAGSTSLQINASGYVSIDSPLFGTAELETTGTELWLDVFVPVSQPNPNWFGDMQMSFSAPAANLNNAFLGTAALTGLPKGQWSTIKFPLPAAVRTALLGDFPRAKFTIAVNSPIGSQPLHLDNLRMSGTLTGRTVHHVALSALPTNPLFGFETLTDWTSPQGALALSTDRVVEGSAALSVPGRSYTEVRSRAFATSELSGVTAKLALSVWVPSQQPNLASVGALQAYFSCPSAGLSNVSLGQVNLTNLFFDEYNRVTFTLPANVVTTLQGNRTDARISFGLSVTATTGQYLFDDLAFTN